MVDLIYAPTDLPVTSELLARADDLVVDSVSMPVLSATDVMLSKLLALQEHYCDFAALLPIARAIREQVDWARLERETEDNAFAQAFLSLTRRLGIRPGLPAGPPGTDATTPTT